MSDPSIYRQLADLEERLARLETAERAGFVGAQYATDAGQSIPNASSGGTVVNYEDMLYDPLGLVTTGAGWVFTVPVAGWYQVEATALFSATTNWGVGEVAEIWCRVNGALYQLMGRHQHTASGVVIATWLGGAAGRWCAAGDTLSVVIYQDSGAPLTLFAQAPYNHISITRLA